jgi:hypothetical protein
MSQRRDDTTEPPDDTPAERAPGRYYYDDSTGYEPYDPAQDEADDDTGEHTAPSER